LRLPLAQPRTIRDSEYLDSIAKLQPDVGVVVAYGNILPPALLQIPKRGFLNVHASLLPKYRGAAPVQRAIQNGERETGVTIMQVDEQLDHGPILAARKMSIDADDHAPDIARQLSELGGDLLPDVLNRNPAGTPQDHSQATYAPKIEKAEGLVNWETSARNIYDKFRAFDPWPGIFTPDFKIIDMDTMLPCRGQPGTFMSIGEYVLIATGEGAVKLMQVQRPGKPPVSAGEYARAAGWKVGDRLPLPP
jgi:methionyl-tRNA formyltransferase